MKEDVCYICKTPLERDSRIVWPYYPEARKMPPGQYGKKYDCHAECVAEKCFGNWKGSWS